MSRVSRILRVSWRMVLGSSMNSTSSICLSTSDTARASTFTLSRLSLTETNDNMRAWLRECARPRRYPPKPRSDPQMDLRFSVRFPIWEGAAQKLVDRKRKNDNIRPSYGPWFPRPLGSYSRPRSFRFPAVRRNRQRLENLMADASATLTVSTAVAALAPAFAAGFAVQQGLQILDSFVNLDKRISPTTKTGLAGLVSLALGVVFATNGLTVLSALSTTKYPAWVD